jgi:hypothetical protein
MGCVFVLDGDVDEWWARLDRRCEQEFNGYCELAQADHSVAW